MLKIFTTQLIGYFNRILEQEEFPIEDGARLLAQAAIGEGSIYIYGADEMAGILDEALNGPEPFPFAKALKELDHVTNTDRVLLFSRFSTDEKAVEIAKKLSAKGVQIVGVSAASQEEDRDTLLHFVDIHIDTKLKKPFIPADDGSRIGFPTLMISLYIYHCLSFTLKEILSEYDE